MKRTGARSGRGPVPLPTRYGKILLLIVHLILIRKSREQFEIRTHKRLLDHRIYPTPQTVDALMKLDLAAGAEVEIQL